VHEGAVVGPLLGFVVEYVMEAGQQDSVAWTSSHMSIRRTRGDETKSTSPIDAT
jgi:hypothetical protein